MAAKKKARKKSRKSNGRDYTYDTEYQSSEKQKKNRAKRNKDRAKAIKAGRASKGDGKDVDHIGGINSGKGTRVVSKSKNRATNKPVQKKKK